MTEAGQPKTVLITGGAKRIGRAIALAFARRKFSVIIHYRHSQQAAEELLQEMNEYTSGHAALQADLMRPSERQRLIKDAMQINGSLDVLVNNASVYRRNWLKDVEEKTARQDFEINFWAPFMLMKDFCHLCAKGCIINMLDQRVAAVDPAAGTYGLAKKCLRDATEAAAIEWAPHIRVNGIAPGVVLPPPGVPEEKIYPLLERVPMKTNTKPQEIAAACTFLATAPTLTGNVLYLDGGLHLISASLNEKAPSQKTS